VSDDGTAYHYTTMHSALSIVESGRLLATMPEPNERAVLWFSRHPYFEPTAIKPRTDEAGELHWLTLAEARLAGGGLVRFGYPVDKLLSWLELLGAADIHPDRACELLLAGMRCGASSGDWMGSLAAIPVWECTVEVFNDCGRWEPADYFSAVTEGVWDCRNRPEFEREWRLLAVRCARSAVHTLTDPRSRRVLDVAERYAKGQASEAELDEARKAACDAACDAPHGPSAWAALLAFDVAADHAWSIAWAAIKNVAWLAGVLAADGSADEKFYAAWSAAINEGLHEMGVAIASAKARIGSEVAA
jgi:hypothetical protein